MSLSIPELETLQSADGALELNLLHLAWCFHWGPLRLNKGGDPNRRSFLRHARGIVPPSSSTELADSIDFDEPEQRDYLTFALAVGVQLGLLVVDHDDEMLRADRAQMTSFFTAGPEARARRVSEALQRLRFWNELHSDEYVRTDAADDDHVSLLRPTGEALIGVRGAAIAALRRLDPDGWVHVDALVDALRESSESYLADVLEAVSRDRVREFVEPFVSRAMVWAGFAELSQRDDDLAFRLTPSGRAALGLGQVPEGPPMKSLVIQPNLEITVMLDGAQVPMLHAIYRVSERRSLSDRVATFALSTATVQRGYGAGTTSGELLALLEANSYTPVPETIRFQLIDWERRHRRIHLFGDGLLLRHPDPEALDMVLGQLRHENPEVTFTTLGPTTAYVGETELVGLERAIGRLPRTVIDYVGERPPCLAFDEGLALSADALAVDFVTAWELGAIAEEQESDRSRRRWRLDLDAIANRWPRDTLTQVVAFLDQAVVGGVPAEQYLLLKAQFDRAATARIKSNVTLVELSSATAADRLAESPRFERWVERRVGPRMFEVDGGALDELRAYLADIGVEEAS